MIYVSLLSDIIGRGEAEDDHPAVVQDRAWPRLERRGQCHGVLAGDLPLTVYGGDGEGVGAECEGVEEALWLL